MTRAKTVFRGGLTQINPCPRCDRVYQSVKALELHLLKSHGTDTFTDTDTTNACKSVAQFIRDKHKRNGVDIDTGAVLECKNVNTYQVLKHVLITQ
jgi:uncharacterized C2H2 Zn-finger protein